MSLRMLLIIINDHSVFLQFVYFSRCYRSHLKRLNSGSVLVMRQIVMLISKSSVEDTLAVCPLATPTSFHGLHAISDEMLEKYLVNNERKKKAKSRIDSSPGSPMRHYQSLRLLPRCAATPQTLAMSRSTPQLRSNITIERSHAVKMAEIAQSISNSRVQFATNLEDVIMHRMKESKAKTKARNFRASTKTKARKWRRASCF